MATALLSLRALLPGRYIVRVDDTGILLHFNTVNPGSFSWEQIDGAEMSRAATARGRRAKRQLVPVLFVKTDGELAGIQTYPRPFGISGSPLRELIEDARADTPVRTESSA